MRIDLGGRGFEFGVASHRGEEARRAVRIVAGARGNADADAVGFEFLRAREARDRDFRFGERQRARLRIAEHVAGDAADQSGLAHLIFADRGMARDHMRHLVREHRRKLRGVVGERDQAARDVKLSGRQREGIDRRRIEDRDLVFQVRPLRRGDELVDHVVDHRLQLRIFVSAAIGREDARMLALRRRLRLGRAAGAAARTRSPAARGKAVPEHPASTSDSSSAAWLTPRRRRLVLCGVRSRSQWSQSNRLDPMSACRDFDLFRAGGFDHRPVPDIDISANSDDPALQRFRLDPGGGKRPLMAFQDSDRQSLRPAPSEIDVNRAPESRTDTTRPSATENRPRCGVIAGPSPAARTA